MALYEIPPGPAPAPEAGAPKTDSELLHEYLAANQPSFSDAYDIDGKLQFLEIDNMDDATLAALIATMQKQFPQAF